jgi:hypothetical protein
MNKYIILIIFLLLIIIFYFKYKKNIEQFSEADINTNTVLNFLKDNKINVTNEGNIQIISSENINIDLDENIVKNGDKIVFNNNKTFKCNKYNLDRNGKLTNDENTFSIDSNNNLTFDKYNYTNGVITKNLKFYKINKNGDIDLGMYIYRNGSLIRKDNNVIIDSSGNVTFNKYKIDISNNQIKNIDNNVTIDKNTNIITNNYTLNVKEKNIKKNDNNISVTLTNDGKAKCNNFEFDNNSNTNKIIFGVNEYLINNGILTNPTNTFTIDNNNKKIVKLNSNKYIYDVNTNDLSGNLNSINQFNILNDIIYFTKNNNAIYDYDNLGSIIYGVRDIILEKLARFDTYNKPLHISSIRFYDYNNKVIYPTEYTVTLNGIANGQFDTINPNNHYDDTNTNNLNNSYGGPKVTSSSLFVNKTNRIENNLPTINTNPFTQILYTQIGGILEKSFDFVGCGLYKDKYLDGITSATNTSIDHRYIFTFNKPQFIKYVEIENRKNYFQETLNSVTTTSYDRILNTNLIVNTIVNDIIKPSIFSCIVSKNVTNTITTDSQTKIQPKSRIEKYTSENYMNTPLPAYYEPILRYYVQ